MRSVFAIFLFALALQFRDKGLVTVHPTGMPEHLFDQSFEACAAQLLGLDGSVLAKVRPPAAGRGMCPALRRATHYEARAPHCLHEFEGRHTAARSGRRLSEPRAIGGRRRARPGTMPDDTDHGAKPQSSQTQPMRATKMKSKQSVRQKARTTSQSEPRAIGGRRRGRQGSMLEDTDQAASPQAQESHATKKASKQTVQQKAKRDADHDLFAEHDAFVESYGAEESPTTKATDKIELKPPKKLKRANALHADEISRADLDDLADSGHDAVVKSKFDPERASAEKPNSGDSELHWLDPRVQKENRAFHKKMEAQFKDFEEMLPHLAEKKVQPIPKYLLDMQMKQRKEEKKAERKRLYNIAIRDHKYGILKLMIKRLAWLDKLETELGHAKTVSEKVAMAEKLAQNPSAESWQRRLLFNFSQEKLERKRSSLETQRFGMARRTNTSDRMCCIHVRHANQDWGPDPKMAAYWREWREWGIREWDNYWRRSHARNRK
eukprot:gnl/TRDRNA2_/TRDRNA2_167222_c0_seq1.p1 gnl/TRDRNA2_/TRDRNA2_167222_c0~~gnl/TRDRNA2_/TRDRNA2_167222_c0_seq1.p1  ORF type:complete len:493 (+),score=72.78 gnl/TRDRNA2_/TRDRNA2_167222_c0_seq1:23-1501(+)